MPKLTKKTRDEIRERLRKGATAEEIIDEYGITRRQVNTYQKQVGVSKGRGKPPVEKEVLDDPFPNEIESDELTPTNTEKETETKKTDDTETEKPPEQEDNNFYCKPCYKRGNKVVLTQGQKYCPECGIELEW